MRILKVSGKVGDMVSTKLDDVEYEGSVPKGFNIGGGDYINFSVDIDTGQIIGWVVPTRQTINMYFVKYKF